MTVSPAKRFYEIVDVREDDAGFAVWLDERLLKTPDGTPFVAATQGLAEAIAVEWRAQGETIIPDTMPLTGLTATTLDRIARHRGDIVDELLRYGETDLLCYRAELPPDLAARQAEVWQPLLDWAAEAYDAPLNVTTGIIPIDQPATSIEGLGVALVPLSDAEISALSSLVRVTGSLVVAMALVMGHIDADGARDASQLDDDHQTERWGEDEEAKFRLDRLTSEIHTVAEFLRLVRM